MPFEKTENAGLRYVRNKVDISEYEKKLMPPRRGASATYLQVKDRLAMLREISPEATLETMMLSDDGSRAVFKCVITIPDGAIGMAHGSETSGDFTDYLEKAETKAVGRALNAVGIGIQFENNDFEYESASTKEYVGVDSATVDKPAASKAPAAPKPDAEPKPAPMEVTLYPVPEEIARLDRDALGKKIDEEKKRMGKNAIKRMADFSQATFNVGAKADMSLTQLQQLYVWQTQQEAA